METLVPRKGMEDWPEKFSSTTQPSRMRLMLLVPCPEAPPFAPGQVKSHSPTQKSNCFCCGTEQGVAGFVACWAKIAGAESKRSTRAPDSFFIAILRSDVRRGKR